MPCREPPVHDVVMARWSGRPPTPSRRAGGPGGVLRRRRRVVAALRPAGRRRGRIRAEASRRVSATLSTTLFSMELARTHPGSSHVKRAPAPRRAPAGAPSPALLLQLPDGLRQPALRPLEVRVRGVPLDPREGVLRGEVVEPLAAARVLRRGVGRAGRAGTPGGGPSEAAQPAGAAQEPHGRCSARWAAPGVQVLCV